MKDLLAAGLDAFRRFDDFAGRSRRTELIGFYIVLMLVSFPITLILPFPAVSWALLLVEIVTALPLVAVMARRLHDVGWSGWWLLTLLPIAVVNIWRQIAWLRFPLEMPPNLPIAIEILMGLWGLAAFVLLLWHDDPEANRFGPNPRVVR